MAPIVGMWCSHHQAFSTNEPYKENELYDRKWLMIPDFGRCQTVQSNCCIHRSFFCACKINTSTVKEKTTTTKSNESFLCAMKKIAINAELTFY